MKLKRLVVIDADSICYICSKDTLEESLFLARELVNNILNYTMANCYYLVLSESPYFRHKIEPLYKTRASTSLLFVAEIKDFLRSEFNAFNIEGIEADDVLATIKLNEHQFNYVITLASIDKDILKGLPGRHFNYKDFTYNTVTEKEAKYHEAFQLITGDTADTIKGIPTFGAIKAEQILSTADTEEDYIPLVFKAYIDYYVNKKKNSYIVAIENFTKNYKLVHLLRHVDEYELLGLSRFNLPKPNLL